VSWSAGPIKWRDQEHDPDHDEAKIRSEQVLPALKISVHRAAEVLTAKATGSDIR
jgi:hypothetical protein